MRLTVTLFTVAVSFVSSLAFPFLKRNDLSSNIYLESARSADTCADPSLANTVFEGFDGQAKKHVINFRWAFVDTDSSESLEFWMLQGPVFLAWEAQQQFTVPLFQFAKPTGGFDYTFVIGTDPDTPPEVSGFVNAGVMAWVYATPVCGSVPLMSALHPVQNDHYYTADADEHTQLLSHGWTDAGVVAYVLPLPSV